MLKRGMDHGYALCVLFQMILKRKEKSFINSIIENKVMFYFLKFCFPNETLNLNMQTMLKLILSRMVIDVESD